MRRVSSGFSIIWVILTMTLALGISVLALHQYLEAQTYKEWIAKETELERNFEKVERNKALGNIRAVVKLCGFDLTQESDTEKVIGLLKDRVDRKKTDYMLPGKAMAMWETIRAAEIQLKSAMDRLATAMQFEAESKASSKTSSDIVAGYTQRKDEHISELDKAQAAVVKAQSDDVERYEARKSNLEAEIQRLTANKTDLEKAQKVENLDLANKKNQVETTLREMVKQEAIFHDLTETMGKIVDPHLDENYAFITLGSRDRLVRGMKFVVFERHPGGAVLWKGEVEVKEIFETSAKVSMTKVSDLYDPIINGDLIYNPLFNATRPKKVVLAGDFGKARYTREVAEARIRSIGCIVQANVTDETDFVIVGDSWQSNPEFEKALLLSIPWRPHFEIFQFLGD